MNAIMLPGKISLEMIYFVLKYKGNFGIMV